MTKFSQGTLNACNPDASSSASIDRQRTKLFPYGSLFPHYGRSDIRRPARRSCGASVDGTSMYARADVERDRSSKVSGRSNIRHRVGAAPRSNKLVGDCASHRCGSRHDVAGCEYCHHARLARRSRPSATQFAASECSTRHFAIRSDGARRSCDGPCCAGHQSSNFPGRRSRLARIHEPPAATALWP